MPLVVFIDVLGPKEEDTAGAIRQTGRVLPSHTSVGDDNGRYRQAFKRHFSSARALRFLSVTHDGDRSYSSLKEVLT